MRIFLLKLSFLVALSCTPALCLEGAQANSDRGDKDHGAAPLIERIAAGEAFSFVYDGKRSQDILPHWKRSESIESLSGRRKLRVTTYRDPATGLEVTSEITTFPRRRRWSAFCACAIPARAIRRLSKTSCRWI